METVIVKLKNGEFFQFDHFDNFVIEDNKLLSVICKDGSCNYFNWDCVSYVVQQDRSKIKDEFIKKEEISCPVCGGRCFVPKNFYEIPGETISFGGYSTQNGVTQCRRCGGKGTIEITLPLG